MGDLWGAAVTVLAGALVGWSLGGRLLEWSRRRCDEALATARFLSLPSKRTLVGLATDRPTSRARVRMVPTSQQAFESERRDGAHLAPRTVSAVSGVLRSTLPGGSRPGR